MPLLELCDLTRLLRECAGEDEAVDLDGDVLDVSFYELGYDSLAILQVTGRIQRDYGIELPEEAIGAETPREFLAAVHQVQAPQKLAEVRPIAAA
ncbi:acyl carrier protein [Kitasatospora sp. NBC_01266]|uniref:acyl carrier protein n=1 Tax=Kitasatospora sp. NBC_01266 TaxID=2903572 RepID=UPI002E300EB9|nr:acyl carrier protein [Kitasatospora sp. NBC_01266]